MSFSAALAPYYDLLNDGADYDADLAAIAPYLPAPAAVGLDLGCGTGEMCLRLARDYTMVAVDASAQMLCVAERKLRAAKRPVCFLQQDLRALSPGVRADFAICLHDTLNYLLTTEDLRRFFEAVSRTLKPGGCFLADLSAPLRFETAYAAPVELIERGDVFCVWERVYHKQKRILDSAFHLFVRESGGLWSRGTDIQRQRCYQPQTVARLLRQSGFALRGQMPVELGEKRLLWACQNTTKGE